METTNSKKQAYKAIKYTLFISILSLFLQACGSVPILGRRQLLLVPDQEVLALSFQQYQDFMSTAPVEKNTPNAQMVERVGTRIANAVETFYRNNGYEAELKNFSWEIGRAHV